MNIMTPKMYEVIEECTRNLYAAILKSICEDREQETHRLKELSQLFDVYDAEALLAIQAGEFTFAQTTMFRMKDMMEELERLLRFLYPLNWSDDLYSFESSIEYLEHVFNNATREEDE